MKLCELLPSLKVGDIFQFVGEDDVYSYNYDYTNNRHFIFNETKSNACCVSNIDDYLKPVRLLDILTPNERRYLQYIVRPFAKRVKYIGKSAKGEEECVMIVYQDGVIVLPAFPKNEYFVGMELDKSYTLKDLGISYDLRF